MQDQRGYEMRDGAAHALRVIVGDCQPVEVVLSVDTNVYADGDVLAATQEVPGMFRVAGQVARLAALTVYDADDQGIAFDLLFLRSDVSIGVENAALTVSDLDAREIIGRVSVEAGDYYDLVANRVAAVPLLDQAVPYLYNPAGTVGYIAAVARGASTYASGQIRLLLVLERN